MSCEVFLRAVNGLLTCVFSVVAVAFVAFGAVSAYVFLRTSTEPMLANEYVALPAILTIVFGILLLIFIVFGCCSVFKEIACCIETYSIFLTILALAQIGLGIFCFVKFSPENFRLAKEVQDETEVMFKGYSHDPSQMDTTQSLLLCCGIDGPDDWNRKFLPQSCCGDTEFLNCTISSKSLYREGCSKRSFDYMCGTNLFIGIALMFVGGVQIFAAILGICLSCACWRYKY